MIRLNFDVSLSSSVAGTKSTDSRYDFSSVMADGFRFEGKNGPEITEPEFRSSAVFREEDKPRKTSSQKSSPNIPSRGDASLLRPSAKGQPDQSPGCDQVSTEEYDEGQIIASAEKEESLQKIDLAQTRQDENLTNFLGDDELETGQELIIVPPACVGSSPGSSGSKVSPIANTAVDNSKEIHESDSTQESISTLSRIESAKQDMKNLKSATLGRMGKMFKIRPATPAEHEKSPDQTEHGVDQDDDQQYGQDPSRKEKTHSLGRMLRLVDKDGAPRKLFSHTRAGSLTRLRKMHSTVGNVAGGPADESRNIFSRMISQFRGGKNQTATNAEPNLQSRNEKANSPKPSLGTRLMMSLSTRGNTPGGTTGPGNTTVDDTSVDRVAVEYTA